MISIDQNLKYVLRRFFCYLLLFFSISALNSQEVSISPEMNIRNYFAYELLGKIGPRYIVYRDKGFLKEVDVFNEFMEQTMTAELVLEKKNAQVYSSIGLDTSFQLIYGYLEADTLQIIQRRYDHKVNLIDSSRLLTIPKKLLKNQPNSVTSEDKSKVLLYSINDKDELLLYVYDNVRQRLISQRSLSLIAHGLKSRDIRNVILSNSGAILTVVQKRGNLGSDQEALRLMYYNTITDLIVVSEIQKEGHYIKDIHVDHDNQNGKIVVCGLYGEKKGKDATGYYIVNKKPLELKGKEIPEMIPFTTEMVDYVSKSKKKKNRVFQDFRVQDVIKRVDGGLLICMELVKEFSRRSSYSSGFDRTAYGSSARRGWVDYYNEDVIIINTGPDRTIDWVKILYKKQFSQDDEGVFSSYFLMTNPSRIRMIYNDEIRNGNTVSEYIFDPRGKVARNSLLSTEHQNLKLRFQDAIQISNREVLVPSESNYTLNLVKITY